MIIAILQFSNLSKNPLLLTQKIPSLHSCLGPGSLTFNYSEREREKSCSGLTANLYLQFVAEEPKRNPEQDCWRRLPSLQQQQGETVEVRKLGNTKIIKQLIPDTLVAQSKS